MSVFPGDHKGYNPDEPRDELGRWTSSGVSSALDAINDRGWNKRTLGDVSARQRATLLANHTYISLSARSQRDWGWDNSDTIDGLSELLPAWLRASALTDAEFRERYLSDDASTETIRQLRIAAKAAMKAQTAGDMAKAADTLAGVVRLIGIDNWKRFLDIAKVKAASAPPIEPLLDFDEPPSAEDLNDWLSLPEEGDEDRNPEVADLLEWIANATPADESDIRQEIKHLFYNVGDTTGGNLLNSALSQVLQPGTTRQDREQILQDYARLTHSDPGDIATFKNIVSGMALMRLPGKPAEPAPERGGVAPTLAEIGLAEREKDWKLGWELRGLKIGRVFGQTLGEKFPVIDRFVQGVATSIKSVDLTLKTYQTERGLYNRVARYLRELSKFNGAKLGPDIVRDSEIQDRLLHLVVPRGPLTAAQRAAFERAAKLAESLGLDFRISPY